MGKKTTFVKLIANCFRYRNSMSSYVHKFKSVAGQVPIRQLSDSTKTKSPSKSKVKIGGKIYAITLKGNTLRKSVLDGSYSETSEVTLNSHVGQKRSTDSMAVPKPFNISAFDVSKSSKECDSSSLLEETPSLERVSKTCQTDFQDEVRHVSKVTEAVVDLSNNERLHHPPLPKVLSERALNFPLYNDLCSKPYLPLEPSKDFVQYSTNFMEGPSVKEILNITRSPESSQNLVRWEQSNIQKLGVEGFQEFKKSLMQDGKEFHKYIQDYLLYGDSDMSDINPILIKCWTSIQPVLKEIKSVHCTESKVFHPHLMYKGYVDCIATYKSKPVLIEWKKASRKKMRLDLTYDDPLQALAYLGAVNYDPSYSFQVKDCLLVFAYTDGSPADVHFLSAQQATYYWELWLRRLRQYWMRNEKGPVAASAVSQAQPQESSTPSTEEDANQQEIHLGGEDQHISCKSVKLEKRASLDSQSVRKQPTKPEGLLDRFLKLWKS